MAVVPVLAVTRQGEQSFVFVVQKQNGMAMAHRTAVTLGDTVGNNYSIVSGLNAGDNVIVSGTQFLVDGMPVIPMGGPPQASPPAAKSAGAQSMNSGAPAADSAAQAKNGGTPATIAAASPVAASHPVHRKHRKFRARRRGHVKPAQVS